VRRLEDDARAGAQLVERDVQEPHQVRRREVLDHLQRNQATQGGVGQRLEIRDRVALPGVEASGQARLHHLVVEVEPARGDAVLLQQGQQLAAPAPEIEHVRASSEHVDIRQLPRPDLVLGSPELVLEAHVLVGVHGVGHRRR